MSAVFTSRVLPLFWWLQQMDDDDEDASEWYDSFGESYDDGPPESPGAAGADSDSWKSRTVGKPGRPAAPEAAGGRAEEELEELLERLRSKEQLLELETTAKGQLAAQLAAALATGATREQELLHELRREKAAAAAL